MDDNKDLINDILNELDSRSERDSAAESENAAANAAAHTAESVPQEPKYPSHSKEPDLARISSKPAAPRNNGPQQARSAQPVRNGQPQRRNVQNGPRKLKKRKKKQSNRLPGVLILTTFIFGLSIVLSLVIIGYGKDMLGIGKSDRTHLLIVPEGATTEDIAYMLEEDGIIKSPKAFKLFSRLRHSDGSYIPGEHFISPSMAYETLINELTTVKEEELGESVQVTIPEGLTLLDAAQILQEEGICDADDFIFNFNSGGFGFAFEDKLPQNTTLKFQRMEGYLFPDTYFFYENMDVEQVCQKIYMNFDNKISGVFDETTGQTRYERMSELGLTLDQLITFASIVQKEAATTDVMTMVASVFWNRLNDDEWYPKLLQSDPTSNYANDVIRPNMQVFDEAIVNAYDTYESTGLPPGAICNPGIEAIDAVLTAYDSDYYYFAANINTAETHFSETLEEHEAKLEEIDRQYEEDRLAAESDY